MGVAACSETCEPVFGVKKVVRVDEGATYPQPPVTSAPGPYPPQCVTALASAHGTYPQPLVTSASTQPPVMSASTAAPVVDTTAAFAANVPPMEAEQLDEGEEEYAEEYAEEEMDAPSQGMAPEAQKIIKAFVRNIVKGVTLDVLNKAGGTSECVIALDKRLTTISLSRAGKKDAKKREIPLENIDVIAVGEDLSADIELNVDDLCVTMVLYDGTAVGVKCKDYEFRDTFALCLGMFADGRRAEVERKKAKRSSGRHSR